MAGLELSLLDEACAEAFSDLKLIQGMARFEGALARASAEAGLFEGAVAETITRVCESAHFDSAALARAARSAGALAIPFVQRLTEQVAAQSAQAAHYVHFGATSQDVSDTATVLCLRPAAARIGELARRLGEGAAVLARAHARTPMLARTLLQPATPVPFGWKVALWLAALSRSLRHFEAAAREACVLQFGGAAGTLAAFGERGVELRAALAAELGLPVAPVTWHSARDGFARLGAQVALLTGAAAKMARDISLLMQAEVGEAFERAGEERGTSSSLPHKRNPAGCLLALEAAQRAPALAATLLAQLAPEHERGLGHWQGQVFTLRELCCSCASALAAMAEVLEGLQVDAGAMRANLERTRGLAYSEAVALRLARDLGKGAAHALTKALCERVARDGGTLLEALRGEPRARALIEEAELAELFAPEGGFGSAAAMIDAALADWREVRDGVTIG